jgi:hypothetical protein
MKKRFISFILHHANRCTKYPEFYEIKDNILSKYAVTIGYEVQHIEGKKCYSCNGTGVHYKYSYTCRAYDVDGCWHCFGGWYKRPQWILLAVKRFGRFVFHKPIQREYKAKNPFEKQEGWKVDKLITGYIDHTPGKYSFLAVYVLFLLYRPAMAKKYFLNNVGTGWRLYWWYPRNWFYNLVYMIRTGRHSYPLRQMKVTFESWLRKPKQKEPLWRQNFKEYYFGPDNDLPF